MRKALIVRASKSIQTVDLDAPEGSYRVISDAVGGYIEAVSLDDDLTMYVNEEGKLDGLPLNLLATLLFRTRFGATDIIMGDAILVGGVDDEGDDLGLSDSKLEEVLTLITHKN
jgi:hypothetical protein